tara:strand:+ start:93 stop:821 length:729 start_codon:yes stop_codon:yes gene_type:complete
MNLKKKILYSQQKLNTIEKTQDYIITKAKFGPSKETRIPLNLTEELSFFTAAIISSSHLKKSKFQISIELTNYELLQSLQKICKKLFNRNFNISPVKQRKNKKQSWHMPIDSKSIYLLFNQVFEVPAGKKTHIIKVPEIIKKSDKSIQSAFLLGIMLTLGGKRHGKGRYGLSTASSQLWIDLTSLFQQFKIKLRIDKWTYKKYKKVYYGLSFKEEDFIFLMGRCRSGQTGQIFETCFQKDQA